MADSKSISMRDDIAQRLRNVRVLMLDVDGVLTDGRIVMNDRGEELKFFDVRDGHGIKMLIRHGIEVIFVTGREAPVVEHRAKDLGVKEVYQKVWDKLKVFEEILKDKGLAGDQVAFVGDDIVDVPVLRRVGFAVAVRDAQHEVKNVAHYITKKRGGRGAVREVCEMILKAQGYWAGIEKKYDFY
ncbi:MAG: HAD-IIIA family hydrolase [Syntrophales bacterium]|nr:HAD-IIIA family hydrolase [Syntrophales bacterium]